MQYRLQQNLLKYNNNNSNIIFRNPLNIFHNLGVSKYLIHNADKSDLLYLNFERNLLKIHLSYTIIYQKILELA